MKEHLVFQINKMRAITLILIFSVVSCRVASYDVRVNKIINKDFILGKRIVENTVLVGRESLWINGRVDEIELDTARYFYFDRPIEMAIGKKFLIFKNDKKYLIIEYNNQKISNRYFIKNKSKYQLKRKELGIPDDLVLSLIN